MMMSTMNDSLLNPIRRSFDYYKLQYISNSAINFKRASS